MHATTSLQLIIFLRSEVFKAREKKSNKKFVAMKKVLMDNEKEGVSTVTLPTYIIKFYLNIFTCFSAVSHYGLARNTHIATTQT